MDQKINKKDPTPAYHQLYLILKNSIIKGQYKIGSRFPTEMFLSQYYGLSRMTIRQALGRLEDEGFILREQGNGTFVIRCEPYLDKQHINIGIVIYKPALEAQWFFPEILSGIHQEIEGEKMNLILLPFDETTPEIVNNNFASNLIHAKNIKGVIVTAEELPREEIEFFINNNIPLILVNLYPEDRSFSFICPDYKNGVRTVVDYLVSLGHRRIAFVGTMFSKYNLHKILKDGFIESMKTHGLEPLQTLVKEADYLGENVPNIVKDLLNEKEKPTAIVCSDDLLAIKALRILHQHKIRVPDQVSITGFNDIAGTISYPELTTVRVPRVQIGRTAAGFICQMISGRAITLQQIIPLELIIRKSCAVAHG